MTIQEIKMGNESDTLEQLLYEKRTFPPPQGFVKKSRIKKNDLEVLYEKANQNLESFWEELAHEKLVWTTPFTKTLSWDPPFAQWFLGGKLNASAQCLDQHLNSSRKNKLALVWEGEPTHPNGNPIERKTYTYEELHKEVVRFSNGLKKLGLKSGDRVAIYMPLIPEAIVAMLACARLGATHSVVFGGFSAEALRDRIQDAKARFLITATGSYRRGKEIPLKANVDLAVLQTPTIEKVIVVDRHKIQAPFNCALDVWYHEILEPFTEEAPESFDSEHPLFILYTSGTTGKPKGIVHSTAGFLLWARLTCEWVFDLNDQDLHWCTADIGWVTGHTYVVYGPLACGATIFLYEGAPDYPSFHRFWKIIEREKVTVFYTAPTAIRSFMRQGESYPLECDLSSLRLLGTVGEPINPEAWMWYHKVIGKERCPIVDTWWQTETGGIMISPVPSVTTTKPGSATQPLPGVFAKVVDDHGKPVPLGHGGKLVLTRPWPAQLRTIYGDNDRYKKQYWSEVCGPGGFEKEPYYFTGDTAHCDQDGGFWIMGRSDDVIKVAGHRLGSMEIESALVSNPFVAEAAVVAKPDDIKGSAVCAFVTLKKNTPNQLLSHSELSQILKQHVTKEIGSLARPEEIRFTDALPKTRSGKIMRRLLRDIACGKATLGDTSTLEDLSVLSTLRDYQDEG